jgi:DNA-directed RNA polymerase subunit RPC12/RpoP
LCYNALNLGAVMPFKDEATRKAYHKKYHAKWYEENKEKRHAQIAEYEKTKPKEWRKAIGRKSNLKLRYNLTPQEYETKLTSQDYKCALCGKDANDNVRRGKVEPLYVDHCHKTNKLRDLLCHQCNSGLGHLKDNIEILQKAIDYLHKHML